MSSVKIKLNSSGVRELLRSSELQEECVSYAQRDSGGRRRTLCSGEPELSGKRGAAVYPADDEGYYDNMKNNTLVKAMGAAKGK